MNVLTEKRFFLDFNRISMLYPREVARDVKDFGVLEQYRDQMYTMDEINEIIGELIRKQPYIPNAMYIKLNFMCRRDKGLYYHLSFEIKNYFYKKQERTSSAVVFLNT